MDSRSLGYEMDLEIDAKYEIVYREGRKERTAVGRYRGLRTSDELSRGGKSRATIEDPQRYHWFQQDGTHGFLSVAPDDLVSYEPVD